jgi:hypothetical protein
MHGLSEARLRCQLPCRYEDEGGNQLCPPALFAHVSRLHELWLDVGDVDAALSAALPVATRLTCLQLGCTAMLPSPAPFAAALGRMPWLQALELWEAALGPDCIEALAPALRALTLCTRLRLNAREGAHGKLESYLHAPAVALWQSITEMPGLRSLELVRVPLWRDAAAAAAAALQQLPWLEHLVLMDCACKEGGPGATAWAPLVPALSVLVNLTSLDLSDSAGVGAGGALLPAVARMPALCQLVLAGCGLDADAAAAFAAKARGAHVLMHVDLSANALGADGVARLRALLPAAEMFDCIEPGRAEAGAEEESEASSENGSEISSDASSTDGESSSESESGESEDSEIGGDAASVASSGWATGSEIDEA